LNIKGSSDEEQALMKTLNEYSALIDLPVTAAGKRILREVLPAKIQELKRQRKRKSA
jgi:hypothetical protein